MLRQYKRKYEGSSCSLDNMRALSSYTLAQLAHARALARMPLCITLVFRPGTARSRASAVAHASLNNGTFSASALAPTRHASVWHTNSGF